MPHQFPFPATPMLQEALEIAMGYLDSTPQAYPYSEIEGRCVNAIYSEWLTGKRHRIWLANKAILAIEHATDGTPTLQAIPFAGLRTRGWL